MVTGRSLTYGRALAIIRAEEYLDAVSYDVFTNPSIFNDGKMIKFLYTCNLLALF
jgi:hypothetical protein